MMPRNLHRTPAFPVTIALAALVLAAPMAAARQNSPNTATSASTTSLGTMVVAPANAPSASTSTTTRLRIQRRALNLKIGSGPTPPATPPQQTHVVRRLPPSPLHITQPEYPAAALAKHTQGTVTVAFTIQPDGSTSDIHVVDSQPPGVFDRAATEAVKKWRFNPATADGTPVSSHATQTLVFRPPARQDNARAEHPAPPSGAERQTPANSVPSNIHPTHLEPPQYPANAYRSRQGGSVTVSFIVGRNGHTRDIRVLASKPHHVFDNAAIEAVKNWRFQPVNSPTRVVQTITFTPPG